MVLRDYQVAAVRAVWDFVRSRAGNPCVVIPTGGGKTPVMAQLCADVVRWGGRVLVLAHVRELLEQVVVALSQLAPELPVGVYSAGLERRELGRPVTVAGVQSVYWRATELGRMDIVLVDEAHRIPVESDSMYRLLLADLREINPAMRVVGLTATPFRLDTGYVYGDGQMFDAVCYEVGVRELMVRGYLCRVVTRGTKQSLSFDSLRIRCGEFVAEDCEALMGAPDVVRAACAEFVRLAEGRRSILVFACGVEHGCRVAACLRSDHGIACGEVYGTTESSLRRDVIEAFRAGELRALVNVNVLTLGFDVPHVDCVVLLRPTLSAGLYYQMVGRGFRVSPEKQDCLVLDYGGNAARHGLVDMLRVRARRSQAATIEIAAPPVKTCPECQLVVAANRRTCPECGYVWPAPEPQHSVHAFDGEIVSKNSPQWYRVLWTHYAVHTKRDAPPGAPCTLRVDYGVSFGVVSEWVCFEHEGYPRAKAARWWRKRSDLPVPDNSADACALAKAGYLREPIEIEVGVEGRYYRVLEHRLASVEQPQAVLENGVCEQEEVPL